ncbi:MAG: HEPN domain-containing protein [Terriglobales bacterium]
MPRTHSLELLLSKLRAGGVAVPPNLLAAAGLTPYAMELRYAAADSVSSDEARAAVRIAEAVLTWARVQVGPST